MLTHSVSRAPGRSLFATLSLALGLSYANSAFAQEAPADEASTAESSEAKINLAPAPLTPPHHRSMRVHDGFYLRGSVGAGGIWTDILDRGERANRFDLDGSAFSYAADLLIGTSPDDGFAIGGGLLWAAGPAKLSGGDEDSDTTIGVLTLGPFFDAFPNSKKGWHLGALVGYAGHSLSDHPSDISWLHGYGGAAWLGHDFWVADEISAGLLLRFNGAITNASSGDEDLRMTSTGLTLLVTALYH